MARELAQNPERGITLPGSGDPTYRNMGRMVSYYDVVAPTAGHEDSLEEAGALNKIMDPGPLEGPWRREAIATIIRTQPLSVSFKKFLINVSVAR